MLAVQRHATDKILPGVETLRCFARSALAFDLLQLWRDGAYDAGGDLILKVEDILYSAVEPVGPQMSAG
jgi:hypothetical protein